LRQIDNETREAVKKKNVKEILIFNWEGEYLHSAVLGDLVNDIGYDENNMILYGLDRSNEILYSYDLSHIIKELQ
jgi:predicted HAD superfamily hydrolase